MKIVNMQLVAVMAAAVILAGRAFAASETETFTINNTEGGSANDSSFTLGGFDPTQGILNSVTLDFELTSSASPTRWV